MHLKRSLQIPSRGLVLEVGGGGAPHPRSQVLVERYLEEDGFAQRGRVPLVVGNRVLIHADGILMPFPKAQFDYTIASHVIEHIPEKNVQRFVNEMQRVSVRGYLEAPSILLEALHNTPEHVWYVACESGILHLCQKTYVSKWHPFLNLNPLFDDGDFRFVIEKHADLFFTGMEWQNSFEVRVHNDLEELVAMYPPNWALELVKKNLTLAEQAKERAKSKDRIKRYIPPVMLDVRRYVLESFRTHLRSEEDNNPAIEWRELVVCPVCHAELKIDLPGRYIQCTSCNRRYVIREDGVPSFIV